MQSSTDLEAVVLGVLSEQGPSTAYRVREKFRRSLSAHWNCSTGAIYPIFARLERRKLIRREKSSPESFGVRYEITPQGTRAIRKWLLESASEGSQLMNFDPLRARLGILTVLSAEEQQQFLDSVRTELQVHLQKIRKDVQQKRKSASVYDYLVARGAYHSVRNQLRWVDEVQRTLQEWDSSTEDGAASAVQTES